MIVLGRQDIASWLFDPVRGSADLPCGSTPPFIIEDRNRYARLRTQSKCISGMSMLNYIWFLISVLAIVSFSCSVDNKDCVCTMEYREYSVYIVNGNHEPIDSLVTWVTDKNSQTVYRTDSSSILNSYLTHGQYIVLTDGEMKYFTSVPEMVIFHALNRKYNITESFTFAAGDECRCHIQKIFGPDSIIVQ
jgi:hypothetical protein